MSRVLCGDALPTTCNRRMRYRLISLASTLTVSYGITGIHAATDRYGIQNVSLSSLSIAELEAKVAELRTMAETARTMDIREALLRLAMRYERVAIARDKASRGIDPGIDAWRLPSEMRRGGRDAFTD